MSTTAQDVIKAAMAVARGAAEGTLDPAGLDAALAGKCRHLFGTVTPDAPLWELQVEVARAVLAAGGIPATELREWASVVRQQEAAADITD